MTELFIKNILTEILFDNKICESFEDQSIVNYLYEELLLDRLLYGEPITVPELRKILHDKIVHFEFIKLDGEVRDVPRGTTMMKYVPHSQQPKGIRPSSKKVATFYDLQKHDWRSVSQKSKEIVLKKDEQTGKPIVMVKDKPDNGGDIAVKPEKLIEPTKAGQPEQPILTVNGKPPEAPIAEPEEKPEVSKVKPVEKSEGEKRYYFINPVTNTTKIMDITPKDVIKKLKELGKNWKLETEKDYKNREDEIEDLTSKEPAEVKKLEPKKTNPSLHNIINKGNKDLDNIEASEL